MKELSFKPPNVFLDMSDDVESKSVVNRLSLHVEYERDTKLPANSSKNPFRSRTYSHGAFDVNVNGYTVDSKKPPSNHENNTKPSGDLPPSPIVMTSPTSDSQEPPTTNGSAPPGTVFIYSTPDVQNTTVSEAKAKSLDLVHRINGMYRLLDLISEQGSGGLVDKVIIAQEHVGRLINTLSPYAYRDLTKVDFKSMDNVHVKPLGVYGSKQEIVRFLKQLGTIDDSTASLLLATNVEQAGSARPSLRPGLYALKLQGAGDAQRLLIVFWPEDTTWNDDAMSTVRRNRITFMRYLTKITDQLVVLVSEEQGSKLVWMDKQDVDESDPFADDDSDRLVSFEVKKASEQEENVQLKDGFAFNSPFITDHKPPGVVFDESKLRTRVVSGECRQGILTVEYIPATDISKSVSEELSKMRLTNILKDHSVSIRLAGTLSEKEIETLARHGLSSVYSDQFLRWERHKEEIASKVGAMRTSKLAEAKSAIQRDAENIKKALEWYTISKVLERHPALDVGRLQGGKTESPEELAEREAYLEHLVSLHPEVKQVLQQHVSQAFHTLESKSGEYIKTKRIVITYLHITQHLSLTDPEKDKLLEFIEDKDTYGQTKLLENKESSESGIVQMIRSVASSASEFVTGSKRESPVRQAEQFARSTNDKLYIDLLDKAGNFDARIAPFVEKSMDYIYESLSSSAARKTRKLVAAVEYTQQKALETNVRLIVNAEEEAMRRESKEMLMDSLKTAYKADDVCDCIYEVMGLEELPYYRYLGDYRITATKRNKTTPLLRYKLYPLSLTEHDRHTMKEDPSHIPTPSLSERFAITFSLPVSFTIPHLQLLECGKCLLIVDTQGDSLYVYLEDPIGLDGALRGKKHKKRILREKLGNDVVTTYDERKRMLVVCGVDDQKSSIQLHSFAFDENYSQLLGQGSTVNLRQWYTDIPKIRSLLFVSGTDDLALVENGGNVRIFSLVTQMFRPASIQLEGELISTQSTPDGSCLVALLDQGDAVCLRAYHWTSFGSHDGFEFMIQLPTNNSALLTSFGQRSNVHLVTIDASVNTCSSLAMGITKQVTEFQFREKNSRNGRKTDRQTIHNVLMDCHAEVWTRFPVIPAVQRQTITSDGIRRERCLIFSSSGDHDEFEPYYKDMIQKFQRGTKKPVGNILSETKIRGCEFSSVVKSFTSGSGWNAVSGFKSGEWMVDIFCLIPIHIAIARDNRFVPLKDGVWAPETEKALLGAEIGRIVDSLSLGWYESIFQSYMSTKPVKVVSSMGEQSVGKSFALNHLVDTSFAGSAMRTTEGVWMSVAPTEKCLLVALDFEGVHSIERSAQEDTLLVLFNAAISNLVLFRNNFALSRDITNLFQSFQTSSTVLDPDANPTLFQSTLVVVIKDVVDSDRDEITKEFRLKLQSIVEQEQANNFITKLHRGNLKIVPWPVIESKQFYTLFNSLRKFLDNDAAGHEAAGVFLQKLKMLMAKLKINDWGSLSQNMASHRAQLLLQLLPMALAYGASEIEPQVEPLKNIDTDLEISHPDSQLTFWISKPTGNSANLSKEAALREICLSWPEYQTRLSVSESDWTHDLSEYIDELLTRRIEHVQAWVNSNLAKFSKSNAAIEELYRGMDVEVVEMRRAVQLCRIQCDHCHLLCLQPRFHENEHNCSTDHACKSPCQFDDEHEIPEPCHLPAGHDGEHICDVIPHLCGEACMLDDKKGCQGTCTKVSRHEDGEHLCSARKHACSEPCGLRDVPTAGGYFTCPSTCVISWNDEHEVHICEASMSCPISCQLCNRLCATANHLHGLKEQEIHLCGQEHKCQSTCAASGICDIDTVPRSIEATFNGRHDKFQYTMYSQVAKRLPCVVPIDPGELSHLGTHRHSMEDDVFHYCEARCGSCGYLCTSKQGHPQAEHSTSHGSMARTQWAVDGPDGTVFELDGHKFGSNDEGAPMMCNLVCRNMGRHLHIDYCRTAPGDQCNEPETKHICEKMAPNPDKPKDWITHNLFWRRLGFKDPYSKDEQTNFSKCDAMCAGPEHEATPNKPAQPSFCTLGMFHAPQANVPNVPGGGYISKDGHQFTCKNPAVLQQAFHVIFVIDRSGSMSLGDRTPLLNQPSADRIVRIANNRLGSVYQAMHSFWSARTQALDRSGAANNRRDAYSAILFSSTAVKLFSNDFQSTPDILLSKFLGCRASGGTNFDAALRVTQQVMDENWSTERMPIVIFLSDGECSVSDNVMYTMCRRAVALGKPLSFHAVSFGPDGSSTYLRRMVDIACEVQRSAPADPLLPANAVIQSSYTVAMDTIRLAETFLGLAESLRKPRGSLLRT